MLVVAVLVLALAVGPYKVDTVVGGCVMPDGILESADCTATVKLCIRPFATSSLYREAEDCSLDVVRVGQRAASVKRSADLTQSPGSARLISRNLQVALGRSHAISR